MLDDVILWTPGLKFLSVRVWDKNIEMDFSNIEKKSRLQLLQVSCGVSRGADLSKMPGLEWLGGYSGARYFGGLRHLTNLTFTSVQRPTKAWVGQLPNSVKELLTTGKLPSGLDLSHLTHLEVFTFGQIRELDFGSLIGSNASIRELHITDVRYLKQTSKLMEIFPGIETVRVARLDRASIDDIKEAIAPWVKIEIY